MEKVILILFAVISVSVAQKPLFENEDDLRKWLKDVYEVNASATCHEQSVAEWNLDTDISNATKREILLNQTLKTALVHKYFWTNYFSKLNVDDYKSEDIKRQIVLLKSPPINEDDLRNLTDIITTMTNIQATAKICPYTKQNCDLENDELPLYRTSEDLDEQTYFWAAKKNATGKKMKSIYRRYVELKNKIAVERGFSNAGEEWRASYETENFIETIDKLWLQVEPLYNELHKYMTIKLKEKYGNKIDVSDGLIPVNIFKSQLNELLKPFNTTNAINITHALLSSGYTPLKMFETANEFYKSLGLMDNSMSYGNNSMIEKPDRDVVCHPYAVDLCNGQDFRIKMCTEVNMNDFETIHHEMGHIQYDLQYKNQPIAFRDSANPGFHEAIGDAIALSAVTPQHLQKIGLLETYDDNEESSINVMMTMALEKINILANTVLVDKWRWDLFNGTVPYERWNEHWWDCMKKYQKFKAPIKREDDDLDPGEIYHVAADVDCIRYFVADILEFQIFKALCVVAGEYDPTNPDKKPLHKCDFYESKEAGRKLMDGMSLGRSKHWSVVLKAITGEEDLDASPLLEYFDPLYTFLLKENEHVSEKESRN